MTIKRLLITQRHDQVDGRNEWRDSLDIRWSYFSKFLGVLPILMPNGIEKIDFYSLNNNSKICELNISQFNKKDVNVIFATPTLEVGVDFSTVNSVMIYGFPFSFNEYVQRIGRGGRKENSLVVTICHRWRPIDHYYMADARRKLSEQHRHYEPIPITRDNPNLIQKHLIGAFWDYISSLDDAHMLFGDIKRKLEPKVEEIGNSMFDTSVEHSPINALGLSESEKTEYQEFLKNYITMEKGRMASSPQQFTKKNFLYDDAKSPDRVYKLTNLRQIENSVEVELIWDVF